MTSYEPRECQDRDRYEHDRYYRYENERYRYDNERYHERYNERYESHRYNNRYHESYEHEGYHGRYHDRDHERYEQKLSGYIDPRTFLVEVETP